jgi:hypothetical protein
LQADYSECNVYYNTFVISKKPRKMRYLLILFVVMQSLACKKKDNCITTTITNSAPGCGGWGIEVNGIKYPSANIPVEFQYDGMQFCAEYELYEDMRLCACCGGTWANIKSMKELPD